MIRPAPIVAALPSSTPFVGPERLMRERGLYTLVRLGANESAFGPSPAAVGAMGAELERTAWYGDPDSFDLRVALAIKHRCTIDHLTVGSGIDDIMGLAVRAYVAPGAVAVTSTGTYPTFDYHVNGYGGVLARADYRDDGKPDLDALARLAREKRAALVYLANPDNPSGTLFARAEIERFAAALPRDAVFFLDEAYADFADESDLLSPTFEDRLIRARTFSKAYGMAGARIGYAITSEDVARTLDKIRLQYGINRNAQIGALAALRDDDFRALVVRETAVGRDEYAVLAHELGTSSLPSRTNFVCIDFGTQRRATEIVRALLDRGVWIRKPGAPPLDRYIRVSVGTVPMRAAFADALRELVARGQA